MVLQGYGHEQVDPLAQSRCLNHTKHIPPHVGTTSNASRKGWTPGELGVSVLPAPLAPPPEACELRLGLLMAARLAAGVG